MLQAQDPSPVTLQEEMRSDFFVESLFFNLNPVSQPRVHH